MSHDGRSCPCLYIDPGFMFSAMLPCCCGGKIIYGFSKRKAGQTDSSARQRNFAALTRFRFWMARCQTSGSLFCQFRVVRYTLAYIFRPRLPAGGTFYAKQQPVNWCSLLGDFRMGYLWHVALHYGPCCMLGDFVDFK